MEGQIHTMVGAIWILYLRHPKYRRPGPDSTLGFRCCETVICYKISDIPEKIGTSHPTVYLFFYGGILLLI